MDCPYCQAASRDVRVLETRTPDPGEVRRQRLCRACGERFSTVERISAHDTPVIKRGRPNERFSRRKLRAGIQKAAAIWTLSESELDSLVERVVKRLHPNPMNPISSAEIGDIVLRVLEGDSNQAIAITRIRYAMVLLGRTSRTTRFKSLHDLVSWLEGQYGPPVVDLPGLGPESVLKRDGRATNFSIKKLERSIGVAAKGRGTDSDVANLASEVAAEATLKLRGQGIVTSQQIASEVLQILKRRDDLAYLRYGSAIKRYGSVDDFWLDILALLAERR